MKKIVLTGASGFIGSHINTMLVNHLYDVYPVSRSDLGNESIFTNDFFGSDNCAGSSALIHLIGAAHSKYSDKESEYINYELTKRFLDRSIELGISRFIFLSTVNVYSEKETFVDDSTPVNRVQPLNTIKSKIMAEDYIKRTAKKTGIEYTIIRSPLVYGSGVKANFRSLIELTSKGLPLPFASISKNRRSLVSISNLYSLIETCIWHHEAANKTFLVSDDDDLSTSEIMREIAIALHKPKWQIPFPVCFYQFFGHLLGRAEVVNRLVGSLQVDITQTKDTLDWSPSQPLKDGFKEAVQTHLNRRNNK
ncbi:NAD-dependent epimerase/dehydratase family protein [Vibrio splendidus]